MKRRGRVKNDRLIGLRKKFNLTQGQVASEVDLTQSMISYIESGRKDPAKSFKISLVNFFNKKLLESNEATITVDWLFYEQINDLKSLKTGTE